MTFKRILSGLAATAALGVGLGAAGSAQATPLVWSVGLSQPGVAVTIGNAPVVPVAYFPVYTPVPVHAPVQVVYPHPHVAGGHGQHRGWHHGHHRGHGHGHPGRGHDH
ncbi:MAG: hypothetical protein RLZZ126_1480 [Pseudomonadota bacterium]